MTNQVIEQSRPKTALVLLGSLGLTAVGYWLAFHPEQSNRSVAFTLIIGWSCLGLFAAASVAAIAQLIKPLRLVINDQGFEVRGLRTKPLVRWIDVDAFFVTRMRGTRFVSYNLKPSAKKPDAPAAFGGADGVVPSSLKMKAEDVCALLEARRSRAEAAA